MQKLKRRTYFRSDDNKEGTFELSHFAELFNEMMMRDSAFKILKSINNAPEKPKEDPKKKEEEKKKKEEEKKKKEEDEKNNKEQEKEEEELNEEQKREKAEERKEEEAKKKEEEKKKRDEEKKKKEEEEEEKKKNTVTMNKDLLLACSYFDLSHIGYFEAKVGLTFIDRLKLINVIMIGQIFRLMTLIHISDFLPVVPLNSVISFNCC